MNIKNFTIILLLFLFILLSCSFSFAANSDNSSNTISSVDASLENNLNKNTSSKFLAAGGDFKTVKLSQKLIWSSSSSVKKYVEKYKKLPNYVVISNEKYSMPEYMHLVSKAIVYKYLKSDSAVNIEYNVKNPAKPLGNSIKKSFSKSSYYDMAKRIYLYIEKNNMAPNYVSTTSGKIQYQTIIYGFSKIGSYIDVNKKLPNTLGLNIKSSHSINKNLPKYTSTNSNPGNSTTIASNAEITTYLWGTGGDVTKNILIKNNIPKSQIITDVLNAAKKGTPIIKFGDGNGPKTLIVSGVHGSELSSQVAAMKLIDYLNELEKGKQIKGTIYIIPFIAPKSTAANARFFNGENLNSIANKAGTLTNNVIKFAKDNKIDAVGDFHCTQPGGVPGENTILGTYSPTAKSAEMAIAISKLTGHPYKNEYQAAKSYPGALEDNLNVNGIPAVTCEVKTPHGTIASGSVSASYNQMIAFLKYNKNI